MTNSINCQSQQIPAYSGITINITNPMLNTPGTQPNCQCQCHQTVAHESTNVPAPNINRGEYTEPVTFNQPVALNQVHAPQQNISNETVYNVTSPITEQVQNQSSLAKEIQQAYPSNYYLNNYNYAPGVTSNIKQNNEPTKVYTPETQNNESTMNKVYTPEIQNDEPTMNKVYTPETQNTEIENSSEYTENDTSISKEIISELDAREAEQKELEKTGKKTKVIALTNEYIMSLENYLNNPNTEIRLMAAKDILTRLDEDHDRYDDAALNALLNKMLQDPNKLVRVAAMSAFASELASGNDYTVQLLNKIQQDPQADPEDVLEASQILLRRSATTEIKYIPQQKTTEQKAEDK